MVVTDTWARIVSLFESDGSLVKVLNPKSCDPQLALDWRPLAAIFLSDGRIFVNNNGPKHAIFDAEGACVETHLLMQQDRRIAAGPDGGYLMIRAQPVERNMMVPGLYVDFFDRSGERLRSHLIADAQPEMYSRFTSGDVTTDQEGGVYASDFADPHVDHFSAQGEHVARLGFTPSYFRHIEGDARSGDDVRRLMNSGTAIMHVHMLDDSTLLIVHENRHLEGLDHERRMGLMVIDTEGRSRLPGEILRDLVWIPYAGDGTMYIQEGPEEEQDAPYIVRYRFVE